MTTNIGYVVCFDFDDEEVEERETFYLTSSFWLGDDSSVIANAHLFDDHSQARRAIALHMLAHDLVAHDDYRIEEAPVDAAKEPS